jgi:hypothetical protein
MDQRERGGPRSMVDWTSNSFEESNLGHRPRNKWPGAKGRGQRWREVVRPRCSLAKSPELSRDGAQVAGDSP